MENENVVIYKIKIVYKDKNGNVKTEEYELKDNLFEEGYENKYASKNGSKDKSFNAKDFKVAEMFTCETLNVEEIISENYKTKTIWNSSYLTESFEGGIKHKLDFNDVSMEYLLDSSNDLTNPSLSYYRIFKLSNSVFDLNNIVKYDNDKVYLNSLDMPNLRSDLFDVITVNNEVYAKLKDNTQKIKAYKLKAKYVNISGETTFSCTSFTIGNLGNGFLKYDKENHKLSTEDLMKAKNPIMYGNITFPTTITIIDENEVSLENGFLRYSFPEKKFKNDETSDYLNKTELSENLTFSKKITLGNKVKFSKLTSSDIHNVLAVDSNKNILIKEGYPYLEDNTVDGKTYKNSLKLKNIKLNKDRVKINGIVKSGFLTYNSEMKSFDILELIEKKNPGNLPNGTRFNSVKIGNGTGYLKVNSDKTISFEERVNSSYKYFIDLTYFYGSKTSSIMKGDSNASISVSKVDCKTISVNTDNCSNGNYAVVLKSFLTSGTYKVNCNFNSSSESVNVSYYAETSEINYTSYNNVNSIFQGKTVKDNSFNITISKNSYIYFKFLVPYKGYNINIQNLIIFKI